MFCGSLLVAFALNRHSRAQKKRDNARNVILQLIEIEHDAGEVCQTSMAYGKSNVWLSVCLTLITLKLSDRRAHLPQPQHPPQPHPRPRKHVLMTWAAPLGVPAPLTPPLGTATDPTAIQAVTHNP